MERIITHPRANIGADTSITGFLPMWSANIAAGMGVSKVHKSGIDTIHDACSDVIGISLSGPRRLGRIGVNHPYTAANENAPRLAETQSKVSYKFSIKFVQFNNLFYNNKIKQIWVMYVLVNEKNVL